MPSSQLRSCSKNVLHIGAVQCNVFSVLRVLKHVHQLSMDDEHATLARGLITYCSSERFWEIYFLKLALQAKQSSTSEKGFEVVMAFNVDVSDRRAIREAEGEATKGITTEEDTLAFISSFVEHKLYLQPQFVEGSVFDSCPLFPTI